MNYSFWIVMILLAMMGIWLWILTTLITSQHIRLQQILTINQDMQETLNEFLNRPQRKKKPGNAKRPVLLGSDARERLRNEYKDTNLTASMLARKYGIARATLYNIVKEKNSISS